eukprot:gene42569-57623_t
MPERIDTILPAKSWDAATATDSALSKKVQAALGDYKGVGVTAAQGVVTLTGQVANTDIGTKAIQAASAVEGVKEVKSELTVASKVRPFRRAAFSAARLFFCLRGRRERPQAKQRAAGARPVV